MLKINLSIATVIILQFLGCGSRQNEHHNERIKAYIEDSLWISKLPPDTTLDKYGLQHVIYRYNRLSNNNSVSDSAIGTLLTRLGTTKIMIETGKIILDEFTDEIIKRETRNVVITFEEFLSGKDTGKYEIEKIHKGYLNSTNRKAHNLYKKYFWDKYDCVSVAQKRIKIGMNKQMVTEAWGHPYDINKSIYSFGVHEQWVYSSSYVYFEDGLVTAIQN